MNDPRPQHKYNKLYTVDYLSNMVGGRKTLYNNQPIDFLKKMVAASIKDGEVSTALRFSVSHMGVNVAAAFLFTALVYVDFLLFLGCVVWL